MLSTAVLGIPIMVLILWFCHVVGVIPICYDSLPNLTPSSRPDCGLHGPEALLPNAAHSK